MKEKLINTKNVNYLKGGHVSGEEHRGKNTMLSRVSNIRKHILFRKNFNPTACNLKIIKLIMS
jgi:hypothetical protein